MATTHQTRSSEEPTFGRLTASATASRSVSGVPFGVGAGPGALGEPFRNDNRPSGVFRAALTAVRRTHHPGGDLCVGPDDNGTSQFSKYRTANLTGFSLRGPVWSPREEPGEVMPHASISCAQAGGGGLCRCPRPFACRVVRTTPGQEAQQWKKERRALVSPSGNEQQSRGRLSTQPRPLNHPEGHPSRSFVIMSTPTEIRPTIAVVVQGFCQFKW